MLTDSCFIPKFIITTEHFNARSERITMPSSNLPKDEDIVDDKGGRLEDQVNEELDRLGQGGHWVW